MNFGAAHDKSGHFLEEEFNTDIVLPTKSQLGPILTILFPFNVAKGKLSLGEMVAGNGLLLPQRQFILFASYPLLRSEERLGKRAAGSWLNIALECNGRLL